MFCSRCGRELQDETQFCPSCGNKAGQPAQPAAVKETKVMLDPAERVVHKEVSDSSKSFSGQGRTIGLILMILSIVVDFVGMFAIGFDAFIPITIAATGLFIIGFLIRIFCP